MIATERYFYVISAFQSGATAIPVGAILPESALKRLLGDAAFDQLLERGAIKLIRG